MNKTSRVLTGTLLIIISFVLIVISPKAQFITLIYGIPLFIIGFFILKNKKEDEIEQRKDLNKKRAKK